MDLDIDLRIELRVSYRGLFKGRIRQYWVVGVRGKERSYESEVEYISILRSYSGKETMEEDGRDDSYSASWTVVSLDSTNAPSLATPSTPSHKAEGLVPIQRLPKYLG